MNFQIINFEISVKFHIRYIKFQNLVNLYSLFILETGYGYAENAFVIDEFYCRSEMLIGGNVSKGDRISRIRRIFRKTTRIGS